MCVKTVTTILCTRRDSVTVVKCVIFRCDRLNILWKSFIGFRIWSKYRSLLGLLSWYPAMPLLEYLPSLGRGTTIHLRIGHPYISPADVRPSNGFGSLAYNKDATVVVPAVAAVGRPPSSESCIMYSLIACACYSSSGGPPMPAVWYDLNGGLPTCIRFIIYQEYMVIVYCYVFFVNLIWYLYLFWLNKHCLSLSLSLCRQHQFCGRIIENGAS